jgi:nucleoside diphosphate kinase
MYSSETVEQLASECLPAGMRALTRIPGKARAYRRETWFREGLDGADRAWGPDRDRVLRHSAMIMIKPDGVAAGCVDAVLEFLAARDFALTGSFTLPFTRMLWRELWRYQLTSATLDRLSVNDLVLQGSGLLLTVRADDPGDLPASVRLSGMKGSADLRRRRPGTLRERLGHPHRVFSFVHVADEPADILRELALLFEPEERAEVLGCMAAPPEVPDHAAVERARAADVGWRYDPTAAATRIVRCIEQAAPPADVCERAIGLVDAVGFGRPVSWTEILDALRATTATFDRWDLATLGAVVITADDPGEPKVIDNPDPAAWRELHDTHSPPS